jgi:hypothetical protein
MRAIAAQERRADRPYRLRPKPIRRPSTGDCATAPNSRRELVLSGPGSRRLPSFARWKTSGQACTEGQDAVFR